MPADKFKEMMLKMHSKKGVGLSTDMAIIMLKKIPGFTPAPDANYPVIKFSKNWNNKLDCDVFTTIRVYNTSKYAKMGIYKIERTDIDREFIVQLVQGGTTTAVGKSIDDVQDKLRKQGTPFIKVIEKVI